MSNVEFKPSKELSEMSDKFLETLSLEDGVKEYTTAKDFIDGIRVPQIIREWKEKKTHEM